MRGSRYALQLWLVACIAFWSGAAQASDLIIGSVMAVRGDVFRDDGGAPGQFVSQIPAFGADFEKGVAERHAGDADGQWEDKIQSPSQFSSS